jgi:D-aminoacyl-tRNA deacylase
VNRVRSGPTDVLAVVVSRADSASVNVGERLLELDDWTEREDEARADAAGGGTYYRLRDGEAVAELRLFDDLHLHLDRPAEAFSEEPALLVFASRHAGDTGPLLTAHTTGNFGPAEFGGRDRELAEAAPAALRRLRGQFETSAPDGYEVGMECTHHGPTDVGAPSLFAELGSSEAEWEDPDGAEAVARGIRSLVEVEPRSPRTVVGFGGGHYVRRFERVVCETDWAVGHVAADWGLADMGDPGAHRDVVRRAFEASGATRALLDGDGDTERMREVIADLGYEVVSETWLRETDGVDLGVVERVEDRLGPVAAGTRFGSRAAEAGAEEGFAETRLPADLLETCVGIDRDRTRELVAANAVAFGTTENGTVPTERVLLAEGGDGAVILDGLVTVLEGKYDEVERDGDTVTARTRGFDPEKARTLGVSEGPAFGRLASGQAVEVNGRVIDPETVESVTEERFSLASE